jgi:predicted RNA-binding protein YlqC (UPF0109 family)
MLKKLSMKPDDIDVGFVLSPGKLEVHLSVEPESFGGVTVGDLTHDDVIKVEPEKNNSFWVKIKVEPEKNVILGTAGQ